MARQNTGNQKTSPLHDQMIWSRRGALKCSRNLLRLLADVGEDAAVGVEDLAVHKVRSVGS